MRQAEASLEAIIRALLEWDASRRLGARRKSDAAANLRAAPRAGLSPGNSHL